MQRVTRVEDRLVIVSADVGVAAYDFDFELHFGCTHPTFFDPEEICVLRTGAIANYVSEYARLRSIGLVAVNSPEEHERASELTLWYPHIEALTPRTIVYDALPGADEVEATFGWPVFLKGARQTSKHDPALSVIRDREQYERAAARYRRDPILHWQRPVLRELLALQPVPGQAPGKIGPSMEFRSFWWHGACVGWGRYWWQAPAYGCADEGVGRELAGVAAAAVKVPFLVVDVARTVDGRWVVIECNDAQESGHAGIAPYALWSSILQLLQPRRRSR